MPTQRNKHKNAAFTLVEIMIVIVIIGILAMLGGNLNLFASRDKSELQKISQEILQNIDSLKTDALLGKTENKQIVRKRTLVITTDSNTPQTITTKTTITTLGSPTTTTTTTTTNKLPTGGSMVIGECPIPASPGTISTSLTIEFTDGKMSFNPNQSLTPHQVIILQTPTNRREIHIDRRTGLTYELAGIGNTLTCP